MQNIIYVSTPLYLANKSNWKSQIHKPSYTPILSTDLHKFEQSLNTIKQGVIRPIVKSSESETYDSLIGDADKVSYIKGPKYQDLRLFLPISLSQQLHTLVIQNFPDNQAKTSDFIHWLELFTIQKFKIATVNNTSGTHVIVDGWSMVAASTLENAQTIFIRLFPISQYSDIVLYWTKLFQSSADANINIYIDDNTVKYVKDHSSNYEPEVSLEDVNCINSQLSALKTDSSEHTLDVGCMVAYNVDMSTLSDLPRDSLNQLVKDIIEFRTRVLRTEREKRNKEAVEESKRRRTQLRQVLEQIRKSKGPESLVDGDEEDDDDDEDDYEEDDDNYNSQYDFMLEKRRLDKEKEVASMDFDLALAEFNNNLLPQLRAKLKEIKLLNDYEAKLVRDRKFYLKELLHHASSEYYDHKRAFKDEEKHLDNQNRKNSALHDPSSSNSSSATQLFPTAHPKPENLTQTTQSTRTVKVPTAKEQKIKLALKKVFESRVQDDSDSEVENSSTLDPAASDLLPYTGTALEAKLQSLRQSRIVDELVYEYLGVYEEDLVDYVFDNITEHRSRSSLLTELHETFDEDSNFIVNKIWEKLCL